MQEADIELICGMIMATEIPQTPLTKLEQIVADADLEYLGTDEAAFKAELMYQELHNLNPSFAKAEWNRIQIDFLQNHSYFTSYCKKTKEPLKQEYLSSLH
jgi:uncharacterized protein